MKYSIKRVLLINLLIGVSIASSVSMIASYFLENKDIQKHLDTRLQQITRFLNDSLSIQIHNQSLTHIRDNINDVLQNTLTKSADTKLIFQVWNRKHKLILHSNNAPTAPLLKKKNIFQRIRLNGKDWRAYSLYNSDLKLQIIAAEPDMFRQQLLKSIIWDNFFVILWSYPILGLLIWFIINRGLRFIRDFSENLSSREATDFSPIHIEKMPAELQPLVIELNTLFDRLKDAFERNKQFASDAAHELRTPLAALKTQAQVSLLAKTEPERLKAAEKLIFGVNRCTHIVQQLLTLSRIGQSEQLNDMKEVNLNSIASEIIAQLVPNAVEKNIDISLNAPNQPTTIRANEISLSILIRNLIDNAIHYTPSGGIVVAKIFKRDNLIVFRVTDSGPGIPSELHERVFERFYRVLGTKVSGSGLGLPIVKQIANLHHAEVKLSQPKEHQGLQIDVTFTPTSKR